MEFHRLLEIVKDEPVFETGLLLAGKVNPKDVRRQLSRWTKTGRILQLRRGLYTLSPLFQKVQPHPFVVANHLVRSSYVSLQSALAYYGLIPEYVATIISVTTGRPGHWDTSLGSYTFQHIKIGMFRNYRFLTLTSGQAAFVATPEKALLDLVYLQPGGSSKEYLSELRLQKLELVDLRELKRQADLYGSSKLQRAAVIISELARDEKEKYKEV